MTVQRILVVDDDPLSREFITTTLQTAGYTILAAADGEDALNRIGEEHPDLVICALRSSHLTGLDFARRAHDQWCDLPLLLIVGRGAVDDALKAMACGVCEFLLKPTTPETILAAVERTARARHAESENAFLRAQACGSGAPPMVAESNSLLEVLRSAARVARSEGAILVTGEPGTGKTRLAEYIHQAGLCAEGPFIRLDCTAVSEEMLEVELMGNERGACTATDRQGAGCFELADGGTLVLDEVGALRPRLQAKLVRILKNGEYERVGGTGTLHTTARVIATTTRNLPALIAQGSFREDLYYRLHEHPLHLAPLRERPADILPLAKQVVENCARRLGTATPVLSPEVEGQLQQWSWPGNVRELELVMEQAAYAVGEGTLLESHLAGMGRPAGAADPLSLEDPSVADALADNTMADVERVAILSTLTSSKGNKTEAARRLGLTARTLSNKMKIWRQAGYVS